MLGKIYGVIAFILLLLAPGAVESEMYITAFAMICLFARLAYLSMKEDGLIRKRKEK